MIKRIWKSIKEFFAFELDLCGFDRNELMRYADTVFNRATEEKPKGRIMKPVTKELAFGMVLGGLIACCFVILGAVFGGCGQVSANGGYVAQRIPGPGDCYVILDNDRAIGGNCK